MNRQKTIACIVITLLGIIVFVLAGLTLLRHYERSLIQESTDKLQSCAHILYLVVETMDEKGNMNQEHVNDFCSCVEEYDLWVDQTNYWNKDRLYYGETSIC